MNVRLRDVAFAVTNCTTRLPFRFGINTMTWAPTLTARVELETDSGPAVGYSADLLVPKWFEKNPQASLRDDVEGLLSSARRAGVAAQHPTAESVFELWWRSYQTCVHKLPVDAPERLREGFGVALIERAVMDAACRAAGQSFFEALREDLFGFRPGALHSDLEGWSLAASLPSKPTERVALRHTVGLVDDLTEASLEGRARVDDGLPESLAADIETYGLTWFKLKLGGDPDADFERFLEFGQVLEACGVENPRFTVDGNEQFTDLGELVSLLERIDRDALGRRVLRGLQYIEQPLPRGISLDAAAASQLAPLAEIAPVILDEADHGIEAFPRALKLGYGGISVKNCKGVFRALINRGLCERHGGFQSAEDLTTLGVLAVQQDLATVAALGLGHVERNGHHYFRGLDHLPPAEAQSALRAHGDLWNEHQGGATLRVEKGELALASLQAPGFGYDMEIEWASRTPIDEWTFPEL